MRTHARRRAVGYVCAALVVVAAGQVARAQGPQAVHETVVVTGSSHPSTFDTVTRAVRVITRDELERLPVATVIETKERGLVDRHTVPNTKMLNEAMKKSLKDPDFIKKNEGLGAIVVTDKRMEPAEHKAFVAGEITKLKAAVDAAKQYAD